MNDSTRLGIFVDRKTISNANQLDALIRCRDVAEQMGHEVDFIFPVDINKIPRMSALFIRARTDPLNVTYVAAQTAHFHGIPVIDDPMSIRICSDKINMYSHLMQNNVSMPKTKFLSKSDITHERAVELFEELGHPLILKEPSTSFSLRVEKVHNPTEFLRIAKRFIKMSDRIVVQQYIESKYDWRIGVLGGKLLYVCKYTMPTDQFKIQATVNGHIVYCDVDSVPEDKVPPHVLNLGIDAANAIGNGLYGVDIKASNGDAYVIEVNDNPSIESGEDTCYPKAFEQIVSHLFASGCGGK